MLGYNEVLTFIKNIYFAKDKRVDESYLPMLVREINSINGINAQALLNAEKIIIREDVRLNVLDVCNVIREQINLNKPKLVYNKVDCPYCEGRGYVTGLRFETNGKYTGYRVALNCCCGNKPQPNMLVMREDISNNHRTETANGGYILVFPTIVEEFEYLNKVYANDNYDLRK